VLSTFSEVVFHTVSIQTSKLFKSAMGLFPLL